eukprot:4326398-Prymnesium_polylepis.1
MRRAGCVRRAVWRYGARGRACGGVGVVICVWEAGGDAGSCGARAATADAATAGATCPSEWVRDA